MSGVNVPCELKHHVRVPGLLLSPVTGPLVRVTASSSLLPLPPPPGIPKDDALQAPPTPGPAGVVLGGAAP